MNLNDYINLAIRTESLIETVNVNTRLNHGVVGIVTEAGELIEAMMKNDMVNIKEEVGDIMWYMAILMDELSLNFDDLKLIYSEPLSMEINEAILNLTIEASKLQDDLKKHVYYSDDLDLANFELKIAKVFNYMDYLSRMLYFRLETVAEVNISKLTARYPEKFTVEHALNRDLEAERKILEEK